LRYAPLGRDEALNMLKAAMGTANQAWAGSVDAGRQAAEVAKAGVTEGAEVASELVEAAAAPARASGRGRRSAG
jgi:hypothetical protein